MTIKKKIRHSFTPNERASYALSFWKYTDKKKGTINPAKNLSEFVNRLIIDKLHKDSRSELNSAIECLVWELNMIQERRDKQYETETNNMNIIVKNIKELKKKQREKKKKDGKP